METRSAPDPRTTVRVVDADAHPTITGGVTTLLPYLSKARAERVAHYGPLPGMAGYRHPAGSTARADAAGPDGSPPGADPVWFAEDLLDRWRIDRVLLNCTQQINVRVVPNADDAAAFAAAFNDLLAERWLSVDGRFRLAMGVAPQDPQLAAAEIRRFGPTRGVAAVLLPLLDVLMGQRHYYPIYEAALEQDLPIMVHPSATEVGYVGAPATAGGKPSSYFERHTALPQIYQANLISLIAEGVFERFPALRVLMAEAGYAWLPHVMWRLDKNWMGLRREVPWVKRPPSEYILEHVRLTTQPLEEPRDPAHVAQILDMVQAHRTLLFSSDYPHWDNDMPDFAWGGVEPALRSRVLGETACELFGARIV
jgi:uncharacterized protein